MPAPIVVNDFLECVRKSGVADPKGLDDFLALPGTDGPDTPAKMADALVRQGIITRFQADQMLRGRWRNFILCGKYTILEPLGAGGMGTVYLCSHRIMRRPVALKVLPASQADDPGAVERFHREAQAVAQLRHRNIVGAHDIDRDGKFHFLVMEYVDGVSLQELVRRRGPLDPERAAHYMHQAALGLEHAHEAGLVHRDIKPANLLVDRAGVVKILDLGLARFFHDKKESLTQKYDGNAVLGTADYLAPEQAIDSHNVDIRGDIYSLGITFYFLLTGHSPFEEGSVAEKLIWHQVRAPKPVREIRPEVPEGMAAVLEKMIAKEPGQRYQTPAELAEALAPWTQTPIDPPSDTDIPKVSAAARLAGVNEVNYTTPRSGSSNMTPTPAAAKPASSGPRRGQSAPAEEVNTRVNGLTSAIPAQATMKGAINAPSSPEDDLTEGADFAKPRGPAALWIGVGAGVLVLLAVAVLVAGVLLLRPSPSTAPLAVAPTPPAPVVPPIPDVVRPPDPVTPVQVGPLVPVAGVAVKQEGDGLHAKTASYEAVVDTEGCLNSLRVGGVEFLKPGDPLAGGKSLAKGAYFYSEKGGHQGAVKLPRIERPADNVVVAGADKFSVRYEFTPEEVVVKPSNNTDDTVPFYVVLNTATVTEVVNGQGQRLSVPVARTQADPLDPAWQTSTWEAGRSRLRITDGTRIWGPFGASNAQVWERSLPTYDSAEIHFKPTIAADEERPMIPPDGVVLTRHYTTRHIQTDLYDAVVEDDGWLSSLRVDGVEFLHPGLNVSRGLYLLQQGPLRLTDVRQPAPNLLTAENQNASIRYEFGPAKMTWTVKNKEAAGMPLYVVFDAGVMAGRTGKDNWVKAPAAGLTLADPQKDAVSWYAGRARLTLTGGNRTWGPWFDHYQVWEASMGPNEERTITVDLARAPDDEVERAAATAGVKPAPVSEMALYAPLDYQVFQRKTRTQGAVSLRGRVRSDFDAVQWRLTGKPLEGAAPEQWQPLRTAPGARTFEATPPAPAGGWYRLEVRALKDGKEVAHAAVEHVGVGEVFVGAGQSNSTNCGQEKIQQHSGMVSSFSGTYWQPADDPQPGAHDDSAGGSFWPAFGDAMAEKYHVPIGVASTGHSGTSVNQWQPTAGEGLFVWTTERMNELGRDGFRAVLWHQGESDTNMSADEYAKKLTNVIEESRGAAGWDAPWFVAQVSYHNAKEPSFLTTRAAQKRLWETGVALEGPDTDTLTGDNRDFNGTGIHFSPKGLEAHGKMWADKVGVWLDKALGK